MTFLFAIIPTSLYYHLQGRRFHVSGKTSVTQRTAGCSARTAEEDKWDHWASPV